MQQELIEPLSRFGLDLNEITSRRLGSGQHAGTACDFISTSIQQNDDGNQTVRDAGCVHGEILGSRERERPSFITISVYGTSVDRIPRDRITQSNLKVGYIQDGLERPGLDRLTVLRKGGYVRARRIANLPT